MKLPDNFICGIEHSFNMPKELFEELNMNYHEAHTNSEAMARMATELANRNDMSFPSIPFCLTVEAEAFGANVKMGDERIGPRILDYAFNDIESMEKIKDIDFQCGRLNTVLSCIKFLKNKGEAPALIVQGPYTVMFSLVDPRVFYRVMRKNKDIALRFMEVIQRNITKYILKAIENGASIISYAEPSGTIDILGPKNYIDMSGIYTYKILKEIKESNRNILMHICGKTSYSMKEAGLIVPYEINIDGEKMYYSDTVLDYARSQSGVKLIGFNCIKRREVLKNKCLYGIELMDLN